MDTATLQIRRCSPLGDLPEEVSREILDLVPARVVETGGWAPRNATANRLALVCTQFQRAATAPLDADAAMLERQITVRSGNALRAPAGVWDARWMWWLHVKVHCADDEALLQVTQYCRQLTSLNVESCRNLTDASIGEVARGCEQLTSLNVAFCRNLTGASVGEVARGCGQLTSLYVAGCENLTDASIDDY